MMQLTISCQKKLRVSMSFGPLTGLRVQHSTTLDEASLACLLLLQTHLVFLLYPTLLMTTAV